MDPNNATPNLEAQKQCFNFLTEIYDILKCFENNPSKLGTKLNDLKLKFEKARAMLGTMPGIDVSMSEQQNYYEELLKQYKRETELFSSYKDMCKFDLKQLEEEAAAAAAAQKSNESNAAATATATTITASTNAALSSSSSTGGEAGANSETSGNGSTSSVDAIPKNN